VLAWWSSSLLGQMAQESIPRLDGVRLSYQVLGFSLLVSILSGKLDSESVWRTTVNLPMI